MRDNIILIIINTSEYYHLIKYSLQFRTIHLSRPPSGPSKQNLQTVVLFKDGATPSYIQKDDNSTVNHVIAGRVS